MAVVLVWTVWAVAGVVVAVEGVVVPTEWLSEIVVAAETLLALDLLEKENEVVHLNTKIMSIFAIMQKAYIMPKKQKQSNKEYKQEQNNKKENIHVLNGNGYYFSSLIFV